MQRKLVDKVGDPVYHCPTVQTANQELDISIIIPCYNEEKNLERGVLDEVYQHLLTQDLAWEVIVVNDESTDRSKSLIEGFCQDKDRFRPYDIPHGGKPAAIWNGIQQSRGESVLFTDMDQSTPISELHKLLPWYEQDYDVVIGSRKTTREGHSGLRKAGSFVFSSLRRLVLLPDIVDTQCGFKLARRQVALALFPHLEFLRKKDKPVGWKVTAYDVELLYLAEKAGYKIQEVEVLWSNRDESDTKSQSGELGRYLNESIQMAQEVIRVKRNERQGLYDTLS